MRTYRHTFIPPGGEPITSEWVSIEAIPEHEQGWFKWMLDEGSTCMASPTQVFEIIDRGEQK